MNLTEFHCEASGMRYWSPVASRRAESTDNADVVEWTLVPEQKCPWCACRHERTVLAPPPAGSESV